MGGSLNHCHINRRCVCGGGAQNCATHWQGEGAKSEPRFGTYPQWKWLPPWMLGCSIIFDLVSDGHVAKLLNRNWSIKLAECPFDLWKFGFNTNSANGKLVEYLFNHWKIGWMPVRPVENWWLSSTQLQITFFSNKNMKIGCKSTRWHSLLVHQHAKYLLEIYVILVLSNYNFPMWYFLGFLLL